MDILKAIFGEKDPNANAPVRRSIKLKNNNSLEYRGNSWYRNGKKMTANDLKNYKLYSYNGYYQRPLPDGNVVTLDLDKNGLPIKNKYIGGNTAQSRKTYWEQAPIVRHAVDSIASKYKISPQLLKARLDAEGFTDNRINSHNEGVKNKTPFRDSDNYSTLKQIESVYVNSPGFKIYGLDTGADLINSGKVKLINENWEDSYNLNEHNQKVHSADGITALDNIGIVGATLKYLKAEAAKRHNNLKDGQLEGLANMYYNRGIAGGERYYKNNGLGKYQVNKAKHNPKSYSTYSLENIKSK